MWFHRTLDPASPFIAAPPPPGFSHRQALSPRTPVALLPPHSPPQGSRLQYYCISLARAGCPRPPSAVSSIHTIGVTVRIPVLAWPSICRNRVVGMCPLCQCVLSYVSSSPNGMRHWLRVLTYLQLGFASDTELSPPTPFYDTKLCGSYRDTLPAARSCIALLGGLSHHANPTKNLNSRTQLFPCKAFPTSSSRGLALGADQAWTPLV